ncbi:RHS repeat-associated core domain-containing protein, partial [Pseudomonas aegrilactucae]
YDPGVGRFVSKDPISYAGGLNLYVYAPNPVGWVDALGLAKSSTSGHSSQAKRGQEFHNDMQKFPYPDGYKREREVKGAGRVDAINYEECAIIERKCTCSARTIKRGEAQVKRYCDQMKENTGQEYEGILDVLDPNTGARSIRVVVPKS